MLTSSLLAPPLARCAACVANETPYGWWILSGIVLLGSVIVAGWFIWSDAKERASWTPPCE